MALQVEWVKSINPNEADKKRGNIIPYVSDFPRRKFALATDPDFRVHSSIAAADSLNEPERGARIGLTIHGRLVLVVEFLDDTGAAVPRDKSTMTSKADEHYCVCRSARLVRSFSDEFSRSRY